MHGTDCQQRRYWSTIVVDIQMGEHQDGALLLLDGSLGLLAQATELGVEDTRRVAFTWKGHIKELRLHLHRSTILNSMRQNVYYDSLRVHDNYFVMCTPKQK